MENTFATNLKKLRQKKGLTQEQVADALHITPQAVSKWENGVANPDLSLIVPLSKLLSVTTDALLKPDGCVNEARKQELINALRSVTNWTEEGRAKQLQVAKILISEFPSDEDANYLYQSCLGDYCRFDAKKEEIPALLSEREKHCRAFLDIANPNRKHGQQAVILALIDILSKLDRRDEAIALADKQIHDKQFQLDCYARALTGDAKEIKFLKNASEKAHDFLRALYMLESERAYELAEGFIYILDPTPNDGYYQNLITLHHKKARNFFKKGQYDKTMEEYAVCAELAIKIEDYVRKHPEDQPWYSHPAFEKCMGTKEQYKDFNPHDMVRVYLTIPDQKVLFERPDHKALLDKVATRCTAYDPFGEKKGE